jgi:hypothetical protein
MTRFARAVADTERRLAPAYHAHYKAGARLARTGGGSVTPAQWCRHSSMSNEQYAAVRAGYNDEMAKPKAQRRGRLGAY